MTLEKRRDPLNLPFSISEVEYGLFAEQLLTGIHINIGGHLVYCNEQFARIHGYRRTDLIGTDISRLIHPEDREMVMEYMRRRLAGEPAPQQYEVRGLTRDGRTIWLVRSNTVIDHQGRRAILGNSIDISRRKEAEEALRKSEAQLRFLSSQLLEAQERERERISHELHDGIGQFLTAVKFKLENAAGEILKAQPRVDLSPLRHIIPVLQQGVEEVRRISMDLRPSILDDLGILATLEWYSREFRSLHPDVDLVKQIGVREEQVPERLKIVIYRLIQEGLHNVIKHSGADRVEVSLGGAERRLTLTIADNGRGFDVERYASRLSRRRGVGLASMKRRVELSGGSWELRSRINEGTRISVVWELSDEQWSAADDPFLDGEGGER